MATSFRPDNGQIDPRALQSPPVAGPQNVVDWWFWLTAPHETANATFAQREAVRRGRLASLTIVFISLNTIVPLPIAANAGFVTTLVITLLINAFALFFLNRRGHLATAGWVVVITLDLGFALAFLSMPQGVSLIFMPAFDLMVEAALVVVAFFRPRSVFVVMVVNILFIAGWLFYGRHTIDIAQILHGTPYILLYPSISLHIFASIITFIWVSSATNAIARLDRSEEIVALERREIAQQEEQLKLKQQLEDGIQKILQTHVLAANGNFAARAPLSRENVLWQVAYSLNNLLARLQRNAELQTQMARTEQVVKMLSAYIRSARETNQPLPPLQKTGTILDELIIELTRPNRPHPRQPERQRLHSLPGESSQYPSSPRLPNPIPTRRLQ